MNGVLFINKPEGLTSRDVVNQIAKIYQTKKVGHTGTLDPLASGVLLVCLGKYTKLVDKLTSYEKEYEATMKLGVKTDTKDITGKVLETKQKVISKEKIAACFQNFPKSYEQTVPIYSAVKVNGKKLYEYAREGKDIPLPTRQVEIKSLLLEEIKKGEITFKTVVSKGTYIRSLIEDLAEAMGTFAVMTHLTRTKQGNIFLKDCLSLDDISKETPLKTLEDLFSYPKFSLDEESYRLFLNGNKLSLKSEEETLFVTYRGEVLGIYTKDNDFYRLVFKAI